MVSRIFKFLLSFALVAFLLGGAGASAQSVGGITCRLFPVTGGIYFWGKDSSNHLKLFSASNDGGEVRQVMDLYPGGNDVLDNSVYCNQFSEKNGLLYFMAYHPSGWGVKLYAHRIGTVEAPFLVADLSGPGNEDYVRWVDIEGAIDLYFNASDANGIAHFYRYDANTDMVSQISLDCMDSLNQACSDDSQMAILIGTSLFFRSTLDASQLNLFLKKPGMAAVRILNESGEALMVSDQWVKAAGRLYFAAYDPATLTNELFIHDGTVLSKVAFPNGNSNPNVVELKLHDDMIIIRASDQNGFEKLFTLDSVSASPVQVSNVIAGGNDLISESIKVGNRVLFTADSSGMGDYRLYSSQNGLPATAVNLAVSGIGSIEPISDLKRFHNRICFKGNHSDVKSFPYCYDPESGDVALMADPSVFRGWPIFYSGNDASEIFVMDLLSKRTGANLFRYDFDSGQSEVLTRYSSTNPNMIGNANYQVLNDHVYFTNGTKNFSEDLGGGLFSMWSSVRVAQVFDSISQFVGLGSSSAFFVTYPDASVDKIRALDFDALTVDSGPEFNPSNQADFVDAPMIPVGPNEFYFSAFQSAGNHLHHYQNGTVTALVTNPAGFDYPDAGRVFGTALFFTALDSNANRFLYHADRTEPLVKFANASHQPINPILLYISSTKVYFSAMDLIDSQIKVFSAAHDGTELAEVFTLISGMSDDVTSLVEHQNVLYYGLQSNPTQLFVYNLDDYTGSNLANPNAISPPTNFTVFQNEVYYSWDQNAQNAVFKLDSSLSVTSVSGFSDDAFTGGMVQVGTSLFFVITNKVQGTSSLQQLKNGSVSEVRLKDSETLVRNDSIKSAEGYLYFVIRSSTGLNELMRYRP